MNLSFTVARYSRPDRASLFFQRRHSRPHIPDSLGTSLSLLGGATFTKAYLTYRLKLFLGKCADVFSIILLFRAYTHIGGNVRAAVSRTRHDILSFESSALLPLPAGIPDDPPLIKCQQKLDASFSGRTTLALECRSLWIALSPFTSARLAAGKILLRVFIWHQLRSLVRTGFGVRAGVGAETLAPSRLYHPLTEGAYR
jgi:hypothetical protein